jgi:hypothetical protein
MISKLHQRLGTAGFAIAIIALIAALGGSAYAAAGLSGKQKKEVEKISKKFAGKKGAVGAVGSVGPAGPAGPAGAAGAKGDAGAAGAAGATGREGPEGEPGEEGSPWTAGGVLPVGSTETGTWAAFIEGEEGVTAISFAIPLAKKPTQVVVPVGGTETAHCDNGTGDPASANNPEAKPGFLCIFIGSAVGDAELQVIFQPGAGVNTSGVGTTGAGLYFGEATEPTFINGTYAVNAGS